MDNNRYRLTALVAARTKLDAASQLAKEAATDIASSKLLPHEDAQEIAADIDRYIPRITSTIELIP